MASKRRNMFRKNKTQETTEKGAKRDLAEFALAPYRIFPIAFLFREKSEGIFVKEMIGNQSHDRSKSWDAVPWTQAFRFIDGRRQQSRNKQNHKQVGSKVHAGKGVLFSPSTFRDLDSARANDKDRAQSPYTTAVVLVHKGPRNEGVVGGKGEGFFGRWRGKSPPRMRTLGE
ncbi:hypothetical protein AAG570_008114 [Ranatra chinensis]|uniref:Uncharacterized protein n=1 Tax=Ranatra chinensis TaxID=642074 RepID=A0ABD0XTU7_9HEMI